jgi:uncharacterized cupredoxin-like copper-binding protein
MKVSNLVSALVLACASASAFAHGGESHARKAYDPGMAEQKAFGIAGDPGKATKTITLSMNDTMRFTPNMVALRQGETVKFVIANNGKIMHEMVIGTMKELKEHAELMKKFPDMEHDEPYMAHVRPGTTEEIVWHFNKPGEFDFGCLIAGHFEAGMTGKIKVVHLNHVAPL